MTRHLTPFAILAAAFSRALGFVDSCFSCSVDSESFVIS